MIRVTSITLIPKLEKKPRQDLFKPVFFFLKKKGWQRETEGERKKVRRASIPFLRVYLSCIYVYIYIYLFGYYLNKTMIGVRGKIKIYFFFCAQM